MKTTSSSKPQSSFLLPFQPILPCTLLLSWPLRIWLPEPASNFDTFMATWTHHILPICMFLAINRKPVPLATLNHLSHLHILSCLTVRTSTVCSLPHLSQTHRFLMSRYQSRLFWYASVQKVSNTIKRPPHEHFIILWSPRSLRIDRMGSTAS